MLRLIAFLVAIALIAAGLAWLADRPGELTVEFEDDDAVVVGPGGVVRVDAPVVRRLVNASDAECTNIALGAKGGYVGRDGRLTDAELAKLEESARANFT